VKPSAERRFQPPPPPPMPTVDRSATSAIFFFHRHACWRYYFSCAAPHIIISLLLFFRYITPLLLSPLPVRFRLLSFSDCRRFAGCQIDIGCHTVSRQTPLAADIVRSFAAFFAACPEDPPMMLPLAPARMPPENRYVERYESGGEYARKGARKEDRRCDAQERRAAKRCARSDMRASE
jgi:hypothetical protein